VIETIADNRLIDQMSVEILIGFLQVIAVRCERRSVDCHTAAVAFPRVHDRDIDRVDRIRVERGKRVGRQRSIDEDTVLNGIVVPRTTEIRS
jgi:hypothetical protein